MRIISLDLSTKSTGYAIWDDDKLIIAECLEERDCDTIQRIKNMSKRIKDIVHKWMPQEAIIEEVLPSDVGGNQSVFKSLIYLQAAVAFVLHQSNIPYRFYVASHWRKLVGIKTGGQNTRVKLKQDMMNLAKEKFNLDVNDDVADAIGIGLAYINENDSAF